MTLDPYTKREIMTTATTRNCALALAMAAGLAGFPQPIRAEGDECIDLYVKRNQIYADAHYCFKTKKALDYFSNKGCIPGEPRLSASQQRRVAEILAEQRRNNCRTE